jgi:hypothetical protein
MQEAYNVTVNEERMPLLVSERGRGRRVCKLPAEICFMAGGSSRQKWGGGGW